MKWVLKTSSIIIGSRDDPEVFGSLDECPSGVRKRLRETLSGSNACTIMITNREGLEALRAGVYPDTRPSLRRRLHAHLSREPLVLPRWQTGALALLAAMAAAVGLLVWAMHSA